MTFEITLSDNRVEWVEGADSWQQEGPMTTFFTTEEGRGRLDAWAVKLASYRTDRLVRIRRAEPRVDVDGAEPARAGAPGCRAAPAGMAG
jgi:hypothetical protein